MKTTKELFDESVERGDTRFAERKEIEARSLSVRLEAQQASEDADQHALSAVTSEALSTAERAIHRVDQAFDALEHLRLELIQIAIGERWHQVERPPHMYDLARELGELTALLQVREVLAQRKETR